MPIPILEDFFPPKNLRNFTPPSRPSPKFGSVVEPTKLVPKANKVDQISAVPNIPSVISCDSARSTAISSVENASSNPQPPSLPPKLRSALSNRPQSFTKGSPCGSVALHRSSTDYSSLHHHNGLSVGLVFPSDSLNEKVA